MLHKSELAELAPIEVFVDGDDVFDRMNELTWPFDLSTDENSIAHGECDLRLVDRMHTLLEPVLGKSGTDGNRWYHLMDFYGDGVRLVEAEWSTVSLSLIRSLHELLQDEHEHFCIAWKVYSDMNRQDECDNGVVVIFASALLITDNLLLRRAHV